MEGRSSSARAQSTRAIIEVEDQCGGIEESNVTFHSFAERRAKDRSGLGLGLSIARQAVHTHSGEIHFQNIPGVGCMFSIELPVAVNRSAALALGRPRSTF
ncbi:MAG: ATP-binding protein [Acidobacteria bacterium]|nr:ATP-binding protein [Acidobacteriota bacterium]